MPEEEEDGKEHRVVYDETRLSLEEPEKLFCESNASNIYSDNRKCTGQIIT